MSSRDYDLQFKGSLCCKFYSVFIPPPAVLKRRSGGYELLPRPPKIACSQTIFLLRAVFHIPHPFRAHVVMFCPPLASVFFSVLWYVVVVSSLCPVYWVGLERGSCGGFDILLGLSVCNATFLSLPERVFSFIHLATVFPDVPGGPSFVCPCTAVTSPSLCTLRFCGASFSRARAQI